MSKRQEFKNIKQANRRAKELSDQLWEFELYLIGKSTGVDRIDSPVRLGELPHKEYALVSELRRASYG